MTYKHPSHPLQYADAIAYVERWLTDHALSDEDRSRDVSAHVVDHLDGDATQLPRRPHLGVRVSEVDFRCPGGGSSYMQTDIPWGIATCSQVERCLLALTEGWNSPENGDGTDEEFDRLNHLFTLETEWFQRTTGQEDEVGRRPGVSTVSASRETAASTVETVPGASCWLYLSEDLPVPLRGRHRVVGVTGAEVAAAIATVGERGLGEMIPFTLVAGAEELAVWITREHIVAVH